MTSSVTHLSRVIAHILGIMVFAVFTAVGANIYIPLPWTPVPITLQTFSVFLSGAVLGGTYGPLSMVYYIMLGLAGMPFFAGGSAGFARILGPTGGYLLGFVVASFVIGKFIGKRPGFFNAELVLLFGIAVVYFFGVLQLCIVTGFSPADAIIKGVLPFLAGDIMKTFVVAGVYSKYHSFFKKTFQ